MQKELLDLINQLHLGNAALIDIREMDEWREMNIPKAIHLPLSQIEKNIESPFPAIIKEQEIYLFCASGRRVQYLIEKLSKKGYTEKKVLPLLYRFEELSTLLRDKL